MTNQLHYLGNCANDFPTDRLLGYHGRYHLPMSATYNHDTNRTVVELRRLTDVELIEFISGQQVKTIEAVEDLVRVSNLFGGNP